LVWKPPVEVTPDGFDALGSPKPTAEGLGWVWRDVQELPTPPRPDPIGEATYRESLAGRPAALTLAALQRVFWTLWQFLERPRLYPEPGTAVA
jgi:hypothetical protein